MDIKTTQGNDITPLAERLATAIFKMRLPNRSAEAEDAEKRELLESAEIALLEKKNITNRKTLVRLNKNDDISRRTTMAALQIAKQKNDSLFNKLVKNRIMERKLLTAIKKKYGSVAQRAAIKGQREYIKGTNSSKILKASDLNNRSKD